MKNSDSGFTKATAVLILLPWLGLGLAGCANSPDPSEGALAEVRYLGKGQTYPELDRKEIEQNVPFLLEHMREAERVGTSYVKNDQARDELFILLRERVSPTIPFQYTFEGKMFKADDAVHSD